MAIEDLLLRREEIIIVEFQPEGVGLQVPIHPALFREDIRLDPTILLNVFENAAQQWFEDLRVYIESCEDARTREWCREAFLFKYKGIERKMEKLQC